MSGAIPMSILKEILEGSPRGILGGVPEEISGKVVQEFTRESLLMLLKQLQNKFLREPSKNARRRS